MRKTFALLIPILLPTLMVAQVNNPAQDRPLVFRHVTLIDMTSEQPKPDMTVIVSGNRIAGIGKNVKIPKNAKVIDASGKFLIPGLWDMHVHTLDGESEKIFFPLFIANGVTGVRDMGTSSSLETVRELKHKVASGEVIGPRIVAAGKILDGPQPKDPPSSIAIATALEGRNAVRLLKREGADFIKVYNGIPREAYFAIADEAEKQGLTFAGHIPISVTAAEASNAGQKSMEHLFGMHEGCADNENELREYVMKYAMKHFNYRRFLLSANAVDYFDEKKAGDLFKLLARNRTWQCPTLVQQFSACYSDDSISVHAHDALLKYIYPELREEWNSAESARQRDYKEYYPKLKLLWSEDLRIVREMHRSGIPLLAGTDALAILYIYPGFSLHDELALFVQAGFTPFEALQTATINPAQYLGREKDLGTVEKGKLADLVLLDANPLADISNTNKINAVVLNGRLLGRDALDKMLADVEASAKNK